MRYLITFTTYGVRLHGDESGSVDRFHNVPGHRLLEPDPRRMQYERDQMKQPPYNLSEEQRATVLSAIQEACTFAKWTLLAAHVRTAHVHVLVEADIPPERILTAVKSHASRRLNGPGPRRKYWSAHGSTRWLWSDRAVRRAMEYVVERQGRPMAVYCAADPPSRSGSE